MFDSFSFTTQKNGHLLTGHLLAWKEHPPSCSILQQGKTHFVSDLHGCYLMRFEAPTRPTQRSSQQGRRKKGCLWLGRVSAHAFSLVLNDIKNRPKYVDMIKGRILIQNRFFKILWNLENFNYRYFEPVHAGYESMHVFWTGAYCIEPMNRFINWCMF
jgi:hypothetical protein